MKGGVRFIVLAAVAAALALATVLFAAGAPHNASAPEVAASSPYFGWFGVLAIALLWLISAVFAGDWNPFALAMGADNRLSTSKMQMLLWTACVGFVYAMVYADRAITVGRIDPITNIPQNVLIALGLSVTSVVAAKAITTTQVSNNPDNKDVVTEPSYDPAALVREDGASTASLNKVQILFWTVIAIVVYLVTAFHQLPFVTTCSAGTCTFPDIDTTLMIFMGLGHATYLGGKLAGGSSPVLTQVTAATAGGVTTIALTGSNLGSTGAILINGQQVNATIVSWTPTAISFVLPAQPDGTPWPERREARAGRRRERHRLTRDHLHVHHPRGAAAACTATAPAPPQPAPLPNRRRSPHHRRRRLLARSRRRSRRLPRRRRSLRQCLRGIFTGSTSRTRRE